MDRRRARLRDVINLAAALLLASQAGPLPVAM